MRGYLPGRVFDALLVIVILVNITSVVVGTVPDLSGATHRVLDLIELVSVMIFTVEYLLRMWACVEDPRRRFHHPFWGRLRYARTPLALIDLLAIAPYYINDFVPIDTSLAIVLRALRLLKLVHFIGAFEVIGEVLKRERRPLIACATVVAIVLIIISTLMFAAEHEAQPDRFGSIPAAMYWGMVTLSTVGYGDLVPVTPAGRLIASFTVILGVLSFAMPAGILASGFIDEVKRRDFIVTWQLVAKVPIFAKLNAARIATIAALLKPITIEPEEMIVRKGDLADRMFFILDGELEVQRDDHLVVLGPGDFFGETALLQRSERTASVVARTEATLLMLMERDFFALLEGQPEIAEQIRATNAARQGRPRPS